MGAKAPAAAAVAAAARLLKLPSRGWGNPLKLLYRQPKHVGPAGASAALRQRRALQTANRMGVAYPPPVLE